MPLMCTYYVLHILLYIYFDLQLRKLKMFYFEIATQKSWIAYCFTHERSPEINLSHQDFSVEIETYVYLKKKMEMKKKCFSKINC